ncbi:hypothetical protein Y032_0059g2951 [Ancylostoma ceylanicum]|uniref:Uncharacterized protein n=1 Tax=Ancylostoma ceylanicum TaxID=53326 RepID=A0A016U3R7_9BILA|nr:hypothetical protein Y032_0059g2951 [Ancylostoma ceylanicum]
MDGGTHQYFMKKQKYLDTIFGRIMEEAATYLAFKPPSSTLIKRCYVIVLQRLNHSGNFPSATGTENAMNIQAIVCSFITAFGTVMICMTTRTVDDDGEFKGKTKVVILALGIALTAIGGLGYVFTIYEVIKRGHEKLVKGEKRKLEEQIDRRRKETVAKEAVRRETSRIRNGTVPLEIGDSWIQRV